MIDQADKTGRKPSYGEELANVISHGVATFGAVIAIPVLIFSATPYGEVTNVIGAAVFGLSMFLLYLASSIYHALPAGKPKRIFLILDHCAIYLLIAGSYTPFTLGILRGSWGWALFGAVWGLAALGIIFKSIYGLRYPNLSIGLYLLMGWLVLIAIKPLLSLMPLPGLLWLLAGGIAYTVGVVFFVLDWRLPYAHFIWHLLVVVGSSCHFVAVLGYAI
jgi:hemolysin III